jgi:hypothetical protein
MYGSMGCDMMHSRKVVQERSVYLKKVKIKGWKKKNEKT